MLNCKVRGGTGASERIILPYVLIGLNVNELAGVVESIAQPIL
jgi:hypothetical protein